MRGDNMKFPKLKNPILCMILSYVVIIVCFYIPAILISILIKHPLAIVISIIACTLGLAIFIFKNLENLTCMDIILSQLHNYYSARKSFECKKNGTNPEKIKSKILKRVRFFGLPVEPSTVSPTPEIIKYSIKSSWTVHYKGIDKLFLSYDSNFLDNASLESIMRSSKINVKQYAGKGKRILTDPCQKTLKVSVASVVVIFADKIDEKIRENLHKILSVKNGDGNLEATVFLVVDLENAIYYFDSVRESFIGYSGYPAKNRAYHMVRKLVFGGKINTYGNYDYVDLPKGLKRYDRENDTLWTLWRELKSEIFHNKSQKRTFEKIPNENIVFEDNIIQYKLNNRAVEWAAELDDKSKKVTVKIQKIWSYPNAFVISKKDMQTIKNEVEEYFGTKNITVIFEE